MDAHAIDGGTRRDLLRAVKPMAAAFDRVRTPPRGVTVLIYHRVAGGSGLEVDLPADVFDAQMRWLAESGRAATIDDALDRLALPAPERAGSDPVVVTFDDGTADFADVAVPVMVRHGIPSTLYVATDFVERAIDFPGGGTPVSWAALADTVATGLVTIGSHTHTHCLLDRLDPTAVADELDRSIELIGERLGVRADHFAYPKALLGHAEARSQIARRFRSAAIAGTRPNPYGRTDPHRLARSPIQVADGMRWFEHKAQGGMRLEDDVRRGVNRLRYRGKVA